MICKILAFAYVSRLSAETPPKDACETLHSEICLKSLTRREHLEKIHAWRTTGIWLKLNQHEYFICVWYVPIYISNGNQLSKCWESNGDMIKWGIKGRVWCRINPRPGKHPTTLKWPVIVENFNQNIFWERNSNLNFQKHLTVVEGSQRGGSVQNWSQDLSSFTLHLCILYLQNLIIIVLP